MDMKKLLHTFDEADEILNDKIDRTNLSTIVASATASVENKKTVLIRGTGRNIEVLKVDGKTIQNGTPTPTNPVEVKGVGDKTVNIFDVKAVKRRDNYVINDSGVEASDTASGYTENFIAAKSNTKYTFSNFGTAFSFRIYYYDKDKKFISRTALTGTAPYTFTTPSNCTFIRFQYIMSSVEFGKLQIEEGETSHPYEPVGYKIPILTDGKSRNIYLDAPLFDGEIADLVGGKAEKKWGILRIKDITGLTSYKTNVFGIKTSTLGINFKRGGKVYSNIYKYGGANSATTIQNGENNAIYSNSDDVILWKDTRYSDNPTSYINGAKDNEYIIYELDSAATETFDGAVIPTSVTEQELELNTEITPASVEVVTFGDYYTKSEVDKKFGVVYGEITSDKGTIDAANTFCVKVGNVVTFRVRITDTVVTGNWHTYALLPFKPIKGIMVYDSNSPSAVNAFNLSESGSISRYAKSETATNFDICGTYITAD